MIGGTMLEDLLSGANLEVAAGRCLKLRHKKSSCRLCLDNCPHGAISIDESVHVEGSLCQGCGVCVNVCPTGVFELRRLSYQSLLSQIEEGAVIEFACSMLPKREARLEVPCLGYLNEAVLTGAIAIGAQSVSLKSGQCDKCALSPGSRISDRSLTRANQILSLFGISGKVSKSVEESNGSPEMSDNNMYSRKEFFSYLRWGISTRVATVVESVNSNAETAAKTKVILEPGLPKKRLLLQEQLKKLGQPVVAMVSTNGLPFAGIEISGSCSGCGMCTTFCPTGALRTYDQESKQVIDFNSGRCLSCHLCDDICPENAISFSANIDPHELITEERKTLIEHKKSICQQCGQTYISLAGSTLCSSCNKKGTIENWLAKTLC